MAHRTRNITCEARFFGIWLIEGGILHYFEARFLMFVAYRTMNATFKARLFWYMAYRTRNITCEVRFFGIWLIEGGILHYFEARFLMFVAYTTMNVTFKARLFWYMGYRTRNITVEACLFHFMAYITRNLRSVSIKHTDCTNRNTLCPDVITRCTLRMCSEYELLAMLTVCTERKLLKLFRLKMVIDSIIEMPSRFYIATRFQLFSFVKKREKLSRRQQN